MDDLLALLVPLFFVALFAAVRFLANRRQQSPAAFSPGDFPGEDGEDPGDEDRPLLRSAPPRSRASGQPARDRLDLSPLGLPTTPGVPAGTPGTQDRLPGKLASLSPLQRAVVLAEILGPPKGLR
jgi:hypothetical protein